MTEDKTAPANDPGVSTTTCETKPQDMPGYEDNLVELFLEGVGRAMIYVKDREEFVQQFCQVYPPAWLNLYAFANIGPRPLWVPLSRIIGVGASVPTEVYMQGMQSGYGSSMDPTELMKALSEKLEQVQASLGGGGTGPYNDPDDTVH